MSNLFDALEKYKFGLLAALLAYVIIFAYFQVGTYAAPGVPYSPFHEGAMIEIPEDEIELQADNIMLPADYDPSKVKNTARDGNDKRKRSEEDYSVSEFSGSGIQSATDYEKSLFEQAEGKQAQKRILDQIAARKAREKEQEKQSRSNDNSEETGGSPNAAAGIVSVEFNLKNRSAKSLKKPIYMCGVGASGRVVIRIKVDTGGNVTSAVHDPSGNQGNVVSCMIQNAQDYARRSRFNYSGSAPKSQSGTITYVFVSQ